MSVEQQLSSSPHDYPPPPGYAERWGGLASGDLINDLHELGSIDYEDKNVRKKLRQFHDALPVHLTPLEAEALSKKVADGEEFDSKLQIQFLSWLGSTTLKEDQVTAKSARQALWKQKSLNAKVAFFYLQFERLPSF